MAGIFNADIFNNAIFNTGTEAVVVPPVPPVVVGGAAGRNRWRERGRKEREIEEVELLAIGRVAIEQIVSDYMNRK